MATRDAADPIKKRITGLSKILKNLDEEIISEVVEHCQFDFSKALKILTKMNGSILQRKTEPSNDETDSNLAGNNIERNDPYDYITKDIKRGYKVLVLMRGLPGSGKSTLAMRLLRNSLETANKDEFIFSVNQYFSEPTKNIYNCNEVNEAYEWNYGRCFVNMKKDVSPIIIDDDNIHMWEMKTYCVMAAQFGYMVKVAVPLTRWASIPRVLAVQNSHGLNEQKIKELLESFQKDMTADDLFREFQIDYTNKMRQFRKYPPLISSGAQRISTLSFRKFSTNRGNNNNDLLSPINENKPLIKGQTSEESMRTKNSSKRLQEPNKSVPETKPLLSRPVEMKSQESPSKNKITVITETKTQDSKILERTPKKLAEISTSYKPVQKLKETKALLSQPSPTEIKKSTFDEKITMSKMESKMEEKDKKISEISSSKYSRQEKEQLQIEYSDRVPKLQLEKGRDQYDAFNLLPISEKNTVPLHQSLTKKRSFISKIDFKPTAVETHNNSNTREDNLKDEGPVPMPSRQENFRTFPKRLSSVNAANRPIINKKYTADEEESLQKLDDEDRERIHKFKQTFPNISLANILDAYKRCRKNVFLTENILRKSKFTKSAENSQPKNELMHTNLNLTSLNKDKNIGEVDGEIMTKKKYEEEAEQIEKQKDVFISKKVMDEVITARQQYRSEQPRQVQEIVSDSKNKPFHSKTTTKKQLHEDNDSPRSPDDSSSSSYSESDSDEQTEEWLVLKDQREKSVKSDKANTMSNQQNIIQFGKKSDLKVLNATSSYQNVNILEVNAEEEEEDEDESKEEKKKEIKDLKEQKVLELRKQDEVNVTIGKEYQFELLSKSHTFKKEIHKTHQQNVIETEEKTNSSKVTIVNNDINRNIDSTHDSNEIIEDGIELNLGSDLVIQLGNIFGQLRQDDNLKPIVQMPKSFAKQLHVLYLESICQQTESRIVSISSESKDDENFLIKLQEDKVRFASQTDTMTKEKEVEEWKNVTPDTLALNLTQQKLHMTFPQIEPKLLGQLLTGHNNSYAQAFEALKTLGITPSESFSVEDAAEPPILDITLKEMKRQDSIVNKVIAEADYAIKTATSYGNDANRHMLNRRELLRLAQEQQQKRCCEVAMFYLQLAKVEQKKAVVSYRNRIHRIMEEDMKSWENCHALNLHSLSVSDPIVTLNSFIDGRILSLRASGKPFDDDCFIITDRGQNSEDISTLKLAITKQLKNRNASFIWINSGMLRVKIQENLPRGINLEKFHLKNEKTTGSQSAC